MRQVVLAMIGVFGLAACGSQDRDRPPAGGSAASGSSGSAAPAPSGPQVPVPAVPAVSHWALDPENSSIGFVSKHVRSNVRGMFAQPAGTVTIDEGTPANSKVTATINPGMITTGVEERDTHLKGPDFFDVAQFPTITFTSTSVSRADATTYTVVGDLALHGVTHPVTLAVTLSPPFDHAGGIRRGVEATTTVNRKDFGINWEYPGEGPGVVVGDAIKVTIDAELVLQPD